MARCWFPCCQEHATAYNIRRYDFNGNIIWSAKIEDGTPILKVMAFGGSTPSDFYVHSQGKSGVDSPKISRYDIFNRASPLWSRSAHYISQQIFTISGLITIVDFEIDGAGNAYVLVTGGPSTATCYVVKLNGDTGQYVWHKQLQWSIAPSTFRPVCRSIAVNTATNYSYVICDPIRRPDQPAHPGVQYSNILSIDPTGVTLDYGCTHGTVPYTVSPNFPTSVDCDSTNDRIFVTLRADGTKNCAVMLNGSMESIWGTSAGNSQFEGIVNGQSDPKRTISFGDFTLAEGVRRFYVRDSAGALADNASFKLMTGPISNVAIYGNRQASRNRTVDAAGSFKAFYALNRVMVSSSAYRTEPKVMLAEPGGGPFLYYKTLDFDNANNKALCVDGFDRAPIDETSGCLVGGILVGT